MAKKYNILIVLLLFVSHIHSLNLSIPVSKAAAKLAKTSLKSHKICSKGEFNGLVILVEFSDTYFTVPNPGPSFQAMLNIEGYGYQGAHGSARDYFITNSDSIFFPYFDVIGPMQLPEPMDYYGQNGENGEEIHAGEMVMEACKLASAEIDFSKYDSNNDNFVDMVYIFFASYCENENQNHPELIWSHAGNIVDSCLILNNKTIGRYACSSEYIGKKTDIKFPQMATIGTFCHEFSHILGLPDFYNTLSGSGFTPGSLSVMDKGNYLDKGRCPAGYSAFEKEFTGWMDVVLIDPSDTIPITLSPVSNHTKTGSSLSAFKIAIPGTKEYFYFENRQAEKWDCHLPATGLFIYHVDMSDEEAWDRNEVNTDYSHPNYQLVRSGVFAKIDYQYIPFPGKDNKTFFPPPATWSGKDTGFELRNIRTNGNQIQLELIGKFN